MPLHELPEDVLFEIVSRLSVRDIVRLRQTSKKFRDITLDRLVWDQVYRSSSLLVPPGPFQYHSAKQLEDILVRSEKLDSIWISPTLAPVNRRVLTDNLNDRCPVSLLLDRWLFVGSISSVRCYDLDDEGGWRRYVAELDNNSSGYKNFQTLATTNSAGVHSAFLLVCDQFLRLYKLHLQNEVQFELVLEQSLRRADNYRADIGGDFLVLSSLLHDRSFLINVHNYRRYEVPAPQCPDNMPYIQAIMTSTHLIMTYTIMGESTWFEALPLPNSSQEESMLSASHTQRTQWYTNMILLCSSPSSIIIMATSSQKLDEKADALEVFELLLEGDGTMTVVDLPTYKPERLAISNLHVTIGQGGPNARGILFRRRSLEDTDRDPDVTTPCAVRSMSSTDQGSFAVNIELGKNTLSRGPRYGPPSAFSGHRGRLICREGPEIVIIDYI